MSHFRMAALIAVSLACIGPARGADDLKQLWEAKDAARLQRLALSPDGKVIAYTKHEFGPEQFKTHVRLCEARTGKQLHLLLYAGKDKGAFPVNPKNPNPPPMQGAALMAQFATVEMVSALAFSPDSKTLATLSTGGGQSEAQLKLWDVATGKQLKQFPLAMMQGQSLTFLPEGRVLAAGLSSKMEPYIRVLETKQGKAVQDILPDLKTRLSKYYPKQPIMTCFEASPDGRTIVVGIGDMQTSYLHVYDTKTQKLDFNLAQLAHIGMLSTATLSPDGKTVALARHTIGFGGASFGFGNGQAQGAVAKPPQMGTTIELIDRASKKKLATVTPNEQADGNQAAMLGETPFRFTPDSRYLVTGGDNAGKVRVWNAQTGEAVGEHATGLKRVTTLALGPNLLATGSDAVSGFMAGPFVGQGGGIFGGVGRPPMPPGDPAPQGGGDAPAVPPGFAPAGQQPAVPPGFQPAVPPNGKIPLPPGFQPFPPIKQVEGQAPPVAPMPPMPPPMPPVGNVGGIAIGGIGGFTMPAQEMSLKVWEWSVSTLRPTTSSSMKD